MAVIKDVAETAGLSVSVVSKYLKNPDSVRPDTKTRIEKAIKELNYVPSAQAQSLRTGRTGMIAVISPNVTNPFFAELFRIIQSQAAKVGYIVVLQTISSIKKTNDEPNERFSTFSSLIRHVDGIIVCFPDDDNVISFLRHQWKKQPIVALNWKADKKADINLLVDVEEGIYKITNYLISIGRKSIGYIGAPEDSVTSRSKKNGYLRAMEENRLEIRPDFIFHGPYNVETGYFGTQNMYQSSERPDAIVTEADIFAFGSIKYCHQNRIKTPDDVAVTGFDDLPMAAMSHPSLTTISLPIKDMGKQAVECLYSLIFKKEIDPSGLNPDYRAQIVIRQSTDLNYDSVNDIRR